LAAAFFAATGLATFLALLFFAFIRTLLKGTQNKPRFIAPSKLIRQFVTLEIESPKVLCTGFDGLFVTCQHVPGLLPEAFDVLPRQPHCSVAPLLNPAFMGGGLAELCP
jgi:hypothetical protein